MPSELYLRKWGEMDQSRGSWEVSSRGNSMSKGPERNYSMDYARKSQQFSVPMGECVKLGIRKRD